MLPFSQRAGLRIHGDGRKIYKPMGAICAVEAAIACGLHVKVRHREFNFVAHAWRTLFGQVPQIRLD